MASLVLLAWFEIWIEPIFQSGMPGPRLPLTLLAAVAVLPLLARRAFPLATLIVMCLGLAAAWIVGKQVHRQRERAGELAEHTALLARTHQLEMHAAVVAERTRIARELHDVVAHSVSVMGIQAGAARRTLAPRQQAQHEALLDVERLGRQALDEMQRMLGVLRTGEEEQGVGPLPDLAQIGALAADARAAGIEVDLHVDGKLDDLSPGLELTAYRIIQEALTNVCKHAHASLVCVTITRSGPRLDITVADDGNGITSDVEAGNGLIGMRERVAIHDGELYAGPGDERGFVIRAQLPVTVSA
jgi:signal transduction histidine kinase